MAFVSDGRPGCRSRTRGNCVTFNEIPDGVSRIPDLIEHFRGVFAEPWGRSLPRRDASVDGPWQSNRRHAVRSHKILPLLCDFAPNSNPHGDFRYLIHDRDRIIVWSLDESIRNLGMIVPFAWFPKIRH